MADRPLSVPATPTRQPENLSLLDWYACHAIAGIAGRTGALREGEEADMARDAFAIAEAMIVAREPFIIASKRRSASRLRKMSDELAMKGHSHDAAKHRLFADRLDAEANALETKQARQADQTKGDTTT